MDHVVMYSGGIASWGAALRVVERYGAQATRLLFTDTLVEDEDLYRFLDEGARSIGAELIRIAEGRTPFEVFRDVRRLGNSQVAPCSRILKQEPSRRWLAEHYPDPASVVAYLGMDWMEGDRHARAAAKWLPYRLESPLSSDHSSWDTDLTREQIMVLLHERGIQIPALYTAGARNNNCAGVCVRGGISHWRWLMRAFPERYAMAEQHEDDLRAELGNVAILADRANLAPGEKRRPLPLRELRLRERKAQGDQFSLLDDDWGSCSCFGSWDDEDGQASD